MDDSPTPHRASPRTTALAALAIFVPLFVLLMWWAFAYRVAFDTGEATYPPRGMLSAATAAVVTTFAAAGPSVVVALFVANRNRLGAVFRRSRGKVLSAIALGFLTPVGAFGGIPTVLGGFLVVLAGFLGKPEALAMVLVNAGLIIVASLAWYPVAAVIVSGVKPHLLRLAVFVLIWWSAFGIALLITGHQEFL
jgi:hypothetical protein